MTTSYNIKSASQVSPCFKTAIINNNVTVPTNVKKILINEFQCNLTKKHREFQSTLKAITCVWRSHSINFLPLQPAALF